jgi:hypothetical protein
MRLRSCIRASGIVLWLCLAPAAALGAGAQAQGDFQSAVASFRAGDYAAALRSFFAARQAGLDTPALRYNLGVTYYRLQRYAEAETEFQVLSQESRWAALAQYNLGLTALRLGKTQQARGHFETAQRSAAESHLRALAGVALERLASNSPPRTGLLFSLAGGYDSSVVLPAEAASLGIEGGRHDYFADANAVATRRLSGSAAEGWNGYGALVLRKYADLSEFDLLGWQLGASRDTAAAGARTSFGGHLGATYIDGHLLEQSSGADVQLRRLDGGHDLRVRYRLARIDGGAHYRHLDGWQQRLRGEAGFELAAAGLRAGYELELNDRRDLELAGGFYSYSPTRHSVFAIAELPRVGEWRVEGHVEYRSSRYRDPHRLDGGTRVLTREDGRYALAARANRGVGRGRQLFVDYSYYRNDSNIDGYSYGRHQLQIGIELLRER